VIYLDSSVALASLLGEDRQPPSEFWQKDLCSSRLLEYEIWTRVHARRMPPANHHTVHALLAEVSLFDMSAAALARALEPFPVPVRTLDALHLATMDFLRIQDQELELASYDDRLNAAARALGLPLHLM
jgi:predicted nucleic acid-binding protein